MEKNADNQNEEVDDNNKDIIYYYKLIPPAFCKHKNNLTNEQEGNEI